MTQLGFNFSVGPALLPVTVLSEVQRDLMAVLGKSFEKMQTSKEYFMFESTDREALEKLRSLGYIN